VGIGLDGAVHHALALEAVHRSPQLGGQFSVEGGGQVEPLGNGALARVRRTLAQGANLEESVDDRGANAEKVDLGMDQRVVQVEDDDGLSCPGIGDTADARLKLRGERTRCAGDTAGMPVVLSASRTGIDSSLGRAFGTSPSWFGVGVAAYTDVGARLCRIGSQGRRVAPNQWLDQ